MIITMINKPMTYSTKDIFIIQQVQTKIVFIPV